MYKLVAFPTTSTNQLFTLGAEDNQYCANIEQQK